jgi:hypothetical protein
MIADRLIPEPQAIFSRFPVPFLVALATFVVLLGKFDDASSLYLIGAASFLAGTSGHLIAESRRWRASVNFLTAFMLASVAAQIGYFAGAFMTSHWFVAAPLLLLMIAPFLRNDVSQESIWTYNLRIGSAVFLSFIFGIVCVAGLSAMAVALASLFGLEGVSSAYQYIWITAVSVIAPIYGLSLIPLDIDDEIDMNRHKGGLMEQGVAVLISFVVIPIVLFYAAILHAYAFKIALGTEIPNNSLGMMSASLLVGGTACWLVAWPWHENGNWVMRGFARLWFWVFPVPAALLATSMWLRVSEFGFTIDRYFLGVIALWAQLIFIYFMMRRYRIDIRAIVGILCVLVFLGSFGPIGASSVTANSQIRRFAEFLEQNKIVVSGAVVNPTPKLDNAELNRGRSIYQIVQEVGALEPSPWFAPRVLTPSRPEVLDSAAKAISLAESLGLNQSQTLLNSFSFNSVVAIDRSWNTPIRQIGPLTLQASEQIIAVSDLSATMNKDMLQIRVGTVTYDVAASVLIEEINKRMSKSSNMQAGAAFDFAVAPGVSLLIQNASGISEPVQQLEYLNFWVMLEQG